jgi:hypothetical protein
VTPTAKFDPYDFLEKLRSGEGGHANHAKRANSHKTASTNSTISTGLPPKSEIASPPDGETIRLGALPSRFVREEEAEPVAGRALQTKYSGAEQRDLEAYADALRLHGPCGYGVIASALGWGAGRAGAAEIELRKAGRLNYPDKTGRGRLVKT